MCINGKLVNIAVQNCEIFTLRNVYPNYIWRGFAEGDIDFVGLTEKEKFAEENRYINTAMFVSLPKNADKDNDLNRVPKDALKGWM